MIVPDYKSTCLYKNYGNFMLRQCFELNFKSALRLGEPYRQLEITIITHKARICQSIHNVGTTQFENHSTSVVEKNIHSLYLAYLSITLVYYSISYNRYIYLADTMTMF